ncbi:MAG: trimeric intracellular cation channel family protein [Bacteroidales bacterium]
MEVFLEDRVIFIIEVVATMAFAISGIRLAAAKDFDWFGAYTVGLITAIGGGTLRDVLLDTPVFWMSNTLYISVTGISMLVVVLFRKNLVRLDNTFFTFDTIGLALYVVIGVQKSVMLGHPMWVAIILGTITGTVGSVLRDILINEPPLMFRKDIYATACIAGGMMYWLAGLMSLGLAFQQILCFVTVVVIRFLALIYNWSMPTMPINEHHHINNRNENT